MLANYIFLLIYIYKKYIFVSCENKKDKIFYVPIKLSESLWKDLGQTYPFSGRSLKAEEVETGDILEKLNKKINSQGNNGIGKPIQRIVINNSKIPSFKFENNKYICINGSWAAEVKIMAYEDDILTLAFITNSMFDKKPNKIYGSKLIPDIHEIKNLIDMEGTLVCNNIGDQVLFVDNTPILIPEFATGNWSRTGYVESISLSERDENNNVLFHAVIHINKHQNVQPITIPEIEYIPFTSYIVKPTNTLLRKIKNLKKTACTIRNITDKPDDLLNQLELIEQSPNQKDHLKIKNELKKKIREFYNNNQKIVLTLPDVDLYASNFKEMSKGISAVKKKYIRNSLLMTGLAIGIPLVLLGAGFGLGKFTQATEAKQKFGITPLLRANMNLEFKLIKLISAVGLGLGSAATMLYMLTDGVKLYKSLKVMKQIKKSDENKYKENLKDDMNELEKNMIFLIILEKMDNLGDNEDAKEIDYIIDSLDNNHFIEEDNKDNKLIENSESIAQDDKNEMTQNDEYNY